MTVLPGLTAPETARAEGDYYPTPAAVIGGYLRRRPLTGRILEPCAGDGAICRAIREQGHWSPGEEDRLTAVEIQPRFEASLRRCADEAHVADFLAWEPPGSLPYHTAITNPPFSLAEAVARRCFEVADATILLLRLGFLATEARRPFWEKHPVNRLFILTNRPSFNGAGNDSSDYAWFVWDGSGEQEIGWI